MPGITGPGRVGDGTGLGARRPLRQHFHQELCIWLNDCTTRLLDGTANGLGTLAPPVAGGQRTSSANEHPDNSIAAFAIGSVILHRYL